MTIPVPLPTVLRSTVPDVVRGIALLAAALAGSVLWLTGRQEGPTLRVQDASSLDLSVDVLVTLLVDNRAYPLFALLLGYGMARLSRRLEPDLGAAAVRRLLARRGLALIGLGGLHALLLSDTDVLGSLGVLVLLTSLLVRARTAALLVVAVLVSPALLVLGALDGVGGQLGGLPDQSSSYLVSMLDRAGSWFANLVLLLPFGTIGLLAPVLLGVLLARAGWLDRPGRHVRGLVAVAVLGGTVSLLGAVPLTLVVGRVWQLTATQDAAAGALSWVTGVAGAVGVCCAVAVLVPRASARLSMPLAALGRVALSAYLVQSLVMGAVLAPWAGGYGAFWGSAEAAALAASTWLLTLVGASRWSASVPGRRGPAEALLRRWTYDRSSGGWPRTVQPSELQGRDRSSST